MRHSQNLPFILLPSPTWLMLNWPMGNLSQGAPSSSPILAWTRLGEKVASLNAACRLFFRAMAQFNELSESDTNSISACSNPRRFGPRSTRASPNGPATPSVVSFPIRMLRISAGIKSRWFGGSPSSISGDSSRDRSRHSSSGDPGSSPWSSAEAPPEIMRFFSPVMTNCGIVSWTGESASFNSDHLLMPLLITFPFTYSNSIQKYSSRAPLSRSLCICTLTIMFPSVSSVRSNIMGTLNVTAGRSGIRSCVVSIALCSRSADAVDISASILRRRFVSLRFTSTASACCSRLIRIQY